jgi:hypothetical protein
MTLYSGQEVIWHKQNKHNPLVPLKILAIYLEPRGTYSALIRVGYQTKTVRVENLEPIKVKPQIIRAGVWSS